MLSTDMVSQKKRTSISIFELLMSLLVFWPFFWNCWVSFQITLNLGGLWGPVYILWGIAIATVFFSKRIRINYITVWILFVLATLTSVSKGITTEWIKDISVLLSFVLICISFPYDKLDIEKMLKAIYRFGLMVAIFVLLDNLTGLFRNTLIGIYSETARNNKLFNYASGGIFSNASMAGCYIVAGAVAFVTLLRIQRKKMISLDAVVISIFSISFILLQKRAFILAIILSVVCIWLMKTVFNMKRVALFSPRKMIRTLLILIILITGLVFLYQKVEYLNVAVNNYLARFFTNDTTLSGRTLLYDLAFRLYRQSPIVGVGWSRYREYTNGIFGAAYTSTYDVHNVYIQLLCETGIIGLAFFIVAIIVIIVNGIKTYKSVLKANDLESTVILEFGLFSQLFFICYCMSGNPLYDYQHLSYYFFGVIICDAIMSTVKLRQNYEQQ